MKEDVSGAERGWKRIWMMMKKINSNLAQIINMTRMDVVSEKRRREALRDLADEDDNDN